MKLRNCITIIFLLILGSIYGQSQGGKKIPFSATFVKKNLEQVGLTQNQWNDFYKLCDKLDDEIKTLRNATGVTKELIKRRDKVYKEMMKDKTVNKNDYLVEMGKRLNLTENQFKGFSESMVLKRKFNQDVSKLLDDHQKVKFLEVKKSKQKKRK